MLHLIFTMIKKKYKKTTPSPPKKPIEHAKSLQIKKKHSVKCLHLIIWFLFRYVYLSVLVMHLFLIYNCSSGLQYRDLKSIRYLPWIASSLSISYVIHTTKKYTCIRSPSVYSFVLKIDIDNFLHTPGRHTRKM